MSAYDVTLVTCDPLPEHDPDMQPLRDALDSSGTSNRVCVWNNPNVDWSASPVTLIRSTWDYYHNRPAFVRWAEQVDAVSRLLNPPGVVEWNSHKSYLLDLGDAGLPTVPTVLVPQGSELELASICAARSWNRVVVKPAVSAASFQTHVVDSDHLDETLFAKLVGRRDMLVQPYVEAFESVGEQSVIVLDGEVSHAVRKSPRYHGEDEQISGPIDIGKRATDLALSALEEVDFDLLYARVDIIDDASEDLMITELELIEPSLFLDYEASAAPKLARALREHVSARPDAASKSSAGTTQARS